MKQLAQALKRHAIDTMSLQLLFSRGREEAYSLSLNGSQAISLWHTLRSIVDETRFWPVLGWDRQTLEAHDEDFGDLQEGSSTDIVEAGLKLDAASWLRDRVQSEPELYKCEKGTWPNNVQARYAFTIPLRNSVTIALVPTTTSWHVPAILRFGGWNNCPSAEEHVCMMKRWNDHYGAEVVGITADVVEMYVTRPPVDRAGARELAWEQFVYCPDTIHQGAETLEALSASLLQATVWHFWWD